MNRPPPPSSVGVARMLDDGTLHLFLRTEADDRTIGEALLIVRTDDPRYLGMLDHMPALVPGDSCSIPPFPD